MKKNDIAIPADPTDPEDFDVTMEGLDRGHRARLVRQVRTKLGLTWQDFAARFHVPLGTLRDWEQARVTVPDFAIAYIRVIRAHPDMVAEIVA